MNANGALDAGETDRNNPDTDTSGIRDSVEQPPEPTQVAGGAFFGSGSVAATLSHILPWMIAMLGGLVLMSRRRTALAMLLAALCFAPSPASSQEGIDVQLLSPPPARDTAYISTAQARVLPHLGWDVGLFLQHAHNPLVLEFAEDQERVFALVADQTTLDLMGAIGLFDRIDVGLNVPIILSQSGETSRLTAVNAASGAGIGDLRFFLRGALITSPELGESGPALTLSASLRLPTGDDQAFQGGELRFEPRANFDWVFSSGTRVGAQLGYLIRPNRQFDNVDSNDQLSLAAASEVILGEQDRGSLVPEFKVDLGVASDGFDREDTPAELLLGGRYRPSDRVMVEAGVGTGLLAGVGSPDWRLFAGVSFHAAGDRDGDGDGLIGSDDQCPTDPEDFDSFEDTDGCPDRDNDNDGVLDVNDGPDGQCMNDPEDADGFEDGDGCPDMDNDFDGILDRSDGPVGDNGFGACLNEPEDIDGFEDDDGCPDTDNDGDGVLDGDDGAVDSNGQGACANAAEDLDGFEDTDGCPDVDNDGDGLFDRVDGEPDANGFGACMNDAEDFDGFEDGDGCPEEGEGLVRLTCDSIDIAERVYFDTGSDVILERSYELLDQIAAILETATHITLTRVEGHTDSRGSDDSNLDLSERRATSVREYLAARGIAAERVEAVGYGETIPIDDNGTTDGRAANRRVVFTVVAQSSDCTE